MSSGYDSERGGAMTAARSTDQDNTSRTRDLGATAGEALSKVSEATQQAGRQARDAATSLASEANEKVKGLMNQQVGAGADLVSHVAQSVRSAADNLDQNIPQLAGLVRGAADRIEEFSEDIRHQSVEQLFQTASDFARRRPAMVFGAAAACGFLLFRLLKNAPAEGSRLSREHWERFGDDRWPREWQGDEERWRRGQMAAGRQGSPSAQTTTGQFHGV
jgi:ElaB/YqjD/DUF883 family membrane-anchored ribosome-binding protein